jgi:hypothetical protein
VFRGLPSGYIANIEERLAQTEAALLQALSVIYESDARQSANHLEIPAAAAVTEKPRELEFNEIRIARVKEWNRFPLNTQEQQQNWMRNKLATTRTSTQSSSEGRQEKPAESTSGPRIRQRYQATGSARKRRNTASEGRDTSNLRPDQEPNFTTSTASSSTRLPMSEVDIGGTASTLDNNSLDAPLGTAVSYLQDQHATTRSPALHHTLDTEHIPPPDTPDVEQEIEPEQYTSKAKRLVTLHSRKYF